MPLLNRGQGSLDDDDRHVGESDMIDNRPYFVVANERELQRLLTDYACEYSERKSRLLSIDFHLFKCTFQCHGNGMADVILRFESEWRETSRVYTQDICLPTAAECYRLLRF